jgi:hypothetical protein
MRAWNPSASTDSSLAQGPSSRGAAKKIPGGQSKYTPATVNRLLRALAAGLDQKQAAKASGIGHETFHRWKREKPEFAEAVEMAREQAREDALYRGLLLGQAYGQASTVKSTRPVESTD